MKYILGIHKKSSNVATRGELGRYPNIIYILKLVIKNWFRITSYENKNSLIYKTYLCNIQLQLNGKQCWGSNIKSFLANTLGLSAMTENSGIRKSDIKRNMDLITKNMECIFNFQWLNELNKESGKNKGDKNKLRTYSKFKKSFEYENYLDLQPMFHLRKNITKLRVSSHKLEIEIGRYSTSKRVRVDPNARICKYCDLHEVEDESHVLMICPNYEQGRIKLFKSLSESFPSFQFLDEIKQFIFLMNCNDAVVTHELSIMLSHIRNVRGSL